MRQKTNGWESQDLLENQHKVHSSGKQELCDGKGRWKKKTRGNNRNIRTIKPRWLVTNSDNRTNNKEGLKTFKDARKLNINGKNRSWIETGNVTEELQLNNSDAWMRLLRRDERRKKKSKPLIQ
jgi:hypothetical protein